MPGWNVLHDSQMQRKCGCLSEATALQLVRDEMYTRAVFNGCVALVQARYAFWLLGVSQETKKD